MNKRRWWNPFSRSVSPAPVRQLRAFAAARHDRLTAEWQTVISSIDADIRAGGVRLRARSRDLASNNDYGRAAFRTIQNNVVGVGVGLQSQAKMKRSRAGKSALNEPVNDAIEWAWWQWCKEKNCDVSGKLSLHEMASVLIRAAAVDGEFIVRLVKQPMGNMKTPLAIEVIECDLLDENLNAIAANGNEIRMGVEVNEWGRPIAYHFRPKHPGDYFAMSLQQRVNASRRVPANEILHRFITERAKQTRGIPWMVAGILRLRHLGGYEEAEVVGARTAASIMGFIEKPPEELVTGELQDGQSVTDFEPGIFKTLFPGEKVSVPNLSRPGAQFDPFVRAMLRALGAGIGVSYESISGDFSQTNYSSSRLSLTQERDNWRVIQKWMIEKFYQPIFEQWLDLAVLSGDVVIPDYYANPDLYMAPRWMARGWSWVDPQREVAAFKEAVRSGFKTQAEIIAEGGGDIEEFMDAREREVKMATDKKLVFDTHPQLVSGAGLSQASQNPKKPNPIGDADAERPDGDAESN